MTRILVVEDDELVGAMVRINLTSEGADVVWTKNGQEALGLVCDEVFDLILLDIALPGKDGITLLGEMRSAGLGTPVLMITARADIDSKVEALELGADDYLSKPFDVAELIARVRALVRRSQARREVPADRVIRFSDYEIDLETREATTTQGKVVLSEKEAAVMAVLVGAGGRPVSRDEILDRVWGEDAFPTNRTVDNYLLRLRKLFEPLPDRPQHIVTVRGVGYRFVG